MTRFAHIPRLRLHNQQLIAHAFTSPAEVVHWMGGFQAQNYPAAKWAIGARLLGATEVSVEQAVADKSILRTWVMRGTIFFIAPQDARWMLSLFAPRNTPRAVARHTQLGLEARTFAKSQKVLARALAGGNLLIRSELFDLLEAQGISTEGQRGYHMLWQAGQDGVLCFGPLRGRQQTFALLDEWAPDAKPLPADEALASLARRYYASHGPATLDDLIWWTGLAPADVRRAHAAIEKELIKLELDGITYWLAAEPPARLKSTGVHLLAPFDEYIMGYQDRRAVLDPGLMPKLVPWKNGMMQASIAYDGEIIGTWKRMIKENTVRIEPDFFNKANKDVTAAFAAAAERYAGYLGLVGEVEHA